LADNPKYTKQVNFIFRSKRLGALSIEQIFDNIANLITNNKKTYLPKENASFFSLCRNIIASVNSSNEINHITGDVHYVIPFLYRKGYNILTIHDLGSLKNSTRYSIKYWLLLYLWYRIPVKFADMVTVISEQTYSELKKYVTISEEKIKIIPNPVDPIFVYVPPLPLDKNNVKLLFIGSTPNKNLFNVLNSLKNISAELTIVGFVSEEAQQIIQKHNIKVKKLYNISLSDLYNEYVNTDILLFPSTYEGFGMPIIESQAVGRPVITSYIEPMKWVAGENGAYFVNPLSVDDINRAIKELIEDSNKRYNLIEAGLKNVSRFKMENIVSQYNNIYKCAESLAK
jgi:glycosyltransferase involved in cell wall biosynthesis